MSFSEQRADMACRRFPTRPAAKAQQLILAGAALEAIAAESNSLIEVIRRIEGYDESKAAVAADNLRNGLLLEAATC